jgi:transcriptional regulator with XRE-family HTH domain
MTMARASRRAGVSPDTQRRVEEGDPGISIATLCAVGDAVGLDIVVRTYRGRGISLRDSGQLEVAEIVCGLAHRSLNPQLEVKAGDTVRPATSDSSGRSRLLRRRSID